MSAKKKDASAKVAKSAETAPITYDRNVEQHKGRKCAICERDGTKIPHRVSGRERWVEVNEEEGFLCSACYFKSRDDEPQATT
jgi:NAD-dependent dihydropyrimidine dehydrogenase PreA subunit